MTNERTDAESVAVLGTGIMGAAMARNLARAGLRTIAWDRTPAVAASLVDAGIRVAGSPAEAIRDAHVVITMLSTADAVRSVMRADGVLEAFGSGAVWAQMGTIGVAETMDLASRVGHARPDVRFVDAPVSGSKEPAAKGELLILASGPREADATVQRAFSALGRKTVWLGEVGQGSRMKLVLNAYLSILVEGIAEAVELADRLGIDEAKLRDVLAGSALDSPIAHAKLRKMEREDYDAEFPLKWALKDVDLAIASAGVDSPPLLRTLSAQWHAALATGLGERDISAARLALRHAQPARATPRAT